MAASKDAAPVWGRPEPGSRRPRFNREQIARCALGIADEEGFEAVSMRRVAAELRAGTMTLYHYVKTRAELISLMDDALMGEALVSDEELSQGWRQALSAISRRTRAVMVRHPWALHSLRDAQFGPNAMRHFEQSLAAVSDTPLTSAQRLELLGTVDDYVFGNVLRTGQVRSRDRTDIHSDEVEAAVEFGLAQLRSGNFPHTAAMFGTEDPRLSSETPSPILLAEEALTEQFERGLGALLDGVAQLLGLESDR